MASNYDIQITDVNKINSTINVTFTDGQVKTYSVVAPAKIDYARVGRATIGVTGDNVTYVKAIIIQEDTQTPTQATTPVQNTPSTNYDNIDRQILIVRQNSYSHAVEIAKMKLQIEPDFDKKDILEQIKEIAHSIEDDVFR